MVSVRVRGIYATAISKILLESGFKLVEASEKVRERLGIDLDAAPCDVTVKDCENVDELLVVGFPGEAGLVYKVLL
ncbi:MAG: RNA-binding protein, partial [Desulfurococcaceae archaeon]